MKRREEVINFLKSHHMHWSDFLWEETIMDFQREMGKGLAGKNSSLAMLPTYIEPTSNFLKNKPVIVIDAGGTNFRIATVVIQANGQITIEHFRKYTMPGMQHEVKKKEFFRTIVHWLKPVSEISDRIGFCFSYPVDMQPNLDGKLIHFSKEIKAPEVEGTQVGQALLESLAENGLENNKKIVLLNDTVATLLAGMSNNNNGTKKYDDYLGLILGTGYNLAYIESAQNIKKLAGLKSPPIQIINTESGNYGGLPQGGADQILDKQTNTPGMYLFEKKVGGAYFGTLCYHIIKLAWSKVFGLNQSDPFEDPRLITTEAISEFLSNPQIEGPFIFLKKEDKEILYFLLDEMVTRSARAVAIQVAAVMIKSNKGKNPLLPICLNLDGSTIHKTHAFREKLAFFLRTECHQKKGIFYEFTKVNEAPLVGAAIAALMP